MQNRVGGDLAVLSGDLNSNCLGSSRVRCGVTFCANICGVCCEDEAELPASNVRAGCLILWEGNVG